MPVAETVVTAPEVDETLKVVSFYAHRLAIPSEASPLGIIGLFFKIDLSEDGKFEANAGDIQPAGETAQTQESEINGLCIVVNAEEFKRPDMAGQAFYLRGNAGNSGWFSRVRDAKYHVIDIPSYEGSKQLESAMIAWAESYLDLNVDVIWAVPNPDEAILGALEKLSDAAYEGIFA